MHNLHNVTISLRPGAAKCFEKYGIQKCSHLSSAKGWHCCNEPARPMRTRADAAAGGSPCAKIGGTMTAALSCRRCISTAYRASLAAMDGSSVVLQ